MNKALSKRIASIDFAKTIGIFGVVAIHSYTDQGESTLIDLFLGYFEFAVPLFIVFSFYLSETKLLNRKVGKSYFINSRFKRLFIPYAFWSLFYYALWNFGSSASVTKVITGYFTGFGWAGQYFLLVMMQLTVIYPFIRTAKFSRTVTIVSFIICVISIYVPLSYLQISPLINKAGFVPFFYSIPYLIWGIFLARQQASPRFEGHIFGLSLILLSPLLMIFERRVIDINSLGYASISSLLSVCVASYYLIQIEPFFMQHYSKHVGIIAQHTLGIFCLNPLIIYLMRKIVEFSLRDLSPSASWLIVWFTSFFVCLGLSLFMGQWNIGKWRPLKWLVV
jgi:surface polysaccharide O-acyltransferase-like enzyme